MQSASGDEVIFFMNIAVELTVYFFLTSSHVARVTILIVRVLGKTEKGRIVHCLPHLDGSIYCYSYQHFSRDFKINKFPTSITDSFPEIMFLFS